MFSYILRRLVFGALTVVGVSIVVFVVMRVLPGDPLVAIFGPDGFTKLSDAERANYMAALGLSDPLWLQYWSWVKDIGTVTGGAVALSQRRRAKPVPVSAGRHRAVNLTLTKNT